ncbi:MAG: hypothetical protein AAF657_31735 [Acidobacteriota bacterium]
MKTEVGRMEAFDALLESLTSTPTPTSAGSRPAPALPIDEAPHRSRKPLRRNRREPRPTDPSHRNGSHHSGDQRFVESAAQSA